MQPAPRVSIRGNHDLRRYILPTEQVVVATRLHWAALLEPVATTVGVFLLVAVVVKAVPLSVEPLAEWLWIVWFAALGRLGFRWLEWRHQWFVSTDKRLLLLYGLVIHKVAMMPLTKVTDMGYTRTPGGQLLGYGRFVMESAGQDQALRQIDYVPQPDQTYRTLCAEIFRAPGARADKPEPGPVPGGATPRPPVVIVRGRALGDGPRPTTQPIPVPVSGSEVPPAAPPAAPAVAPVTPHWDTPGDWQRPRPYDPNPR
ncbi:PH domain-containing protein [Xylanimonas sp. McL0601]|uniref:PH domain-containing protein n=1 Tax=Xylanimonas sp. McL0601 TaxID=3414739 RepID=UPI003CF3ACEF